MMERKGLETSRYLGGDPMLSIQLIQNISFVKIKIFILLTIMLSTNTIS